LPNKNSPEQGSEPTNINEAWEGMVYAFVGGYATSLKDEGTDATDLRKWIKQDFYEWAPRQDQLCYQILEMLDDRLCRALDVFVPE
jgi:hypothetical protein